uniref:Aldehyde dehydrogenase n=1 Tax=Spongospora subterranea TaxID=70186 RepID=A0A0H5QGD3_9EUKA|eukprot:CRZ00652.1 hypothetical protein [Spongospora subterranea]
MSQPSSPADITSAVEHFRSAPPIPVPHRYSVLKAIRSFLVEQNQSLLDALSSDLGRARYESVISDIEIALSSTDEAISHLNDWVRSRSVPTPLIAMPGSSRIKPYPKGTVLIISPFNFPVQLAICPLVSAIAAGNRCVLKPSELTPATSALFANSLVKYISPSILRVIVGGPETSTLLLQQKFDHIFFTGSERVGKIVLQAAAVHLTPVTLELGGKSPVIMCQGSNIDLAAKRIMWSKWVNCGQTCIACDYAIVIAPHYDQFIEACSDALSSFAAGSSVAESPSYSRIVSQAHTMRLKGLIDLCSSSIICGGDVDIESRFCAPTIIGPVDIDSELLKSEIFGPILPVVKVSSIDEAIKLSNRVCSTPLALYIFGSSDQAEQIISQTQSGTVCVNDCVVQHAVPSFPFGGVGHSGMGQSHGIYGFRTFSHMRPILERSANSIFDVSIRYPPYSEKSEKLLVMAMRCTRLTSSSLIAAAMMAICVVIVAVVAGFMLK